MRYLGKLNLKKKKEKPKAKRKTLTFLAEVTIFSKLIFVLLSLSY